MATKVLVGLSDRIRRTVGQSPADHGLARLGPLVRTVRRGSGGRIPPQFKGFPFTAPTWPSTVERDSESTDLGINYDTEWSRSPVSRTVRRALVEAVMRPGVQALAAPAVSGLDRLESVVGPVIFAANHQSHMDTFLLLTVIPTRFRKRMVVAAGADYFFDKRWKATLSALSIGAIPIERRKVSRTSSDRAQQLLRQGWSLMIFPEGGRSPDGWAGEFKAGAAFLSVRTGLPIVPVHIEGTGRILPKGSKLPRRGATAVTYGEPLHPREGEDARSLSTRMEAAIAQLADEQSDGWWVARRNAAAGTTPPLQGPAGVAGWRKTWALETSKSSQRRPKRTWP